MKRLINIIIAILLLIYSVDMLHSCISCLLSTFDIANSCASDIEIISFSKIEWIIRWITFAGFFTIWGIAGLVASIGLLMNKKWAWMICLILFVLNSVHDIIYMFPGVAKNPWEIIEWNEFFVRLCIDIPLCVYFFYMYKNFNIDAEQSSAKGSPGHSGFEHLEGIEH